MVEVKNNEIKFSRKELAKTRNNTKFNSVTPAERARRKKEELQKKVIETVNKDGGKYITVDDQTYILAAGAIENNMVVFVVVNSERNLECIDATKRYKLAKEIPAALSVLDMIYTHQASDFKDIITEKLKNFKTFTSNHLKAPLKKKRTPGNKNYKNNKNLKKPKSQKRIVQK